MLKVRKCLSVYISLHGMKVSEYIISSDIFLGSTLPAEMFGGVIFGLKPG